MALSERAARPPRDPGLQAERTALAWHRTALALVTNALLSLRAGVVSDQPLVLALGSVLVCAAATAAMMGVRRKRMLIDDPQVTAPPPWMPAAVTIAALAACLSGAAGVVAAALR